MRASRFRGDLQFPTWPRCIQAFSDYNSCQHLNCHLPDPWPTEIVRWWTFAALSPGFEATHYKEISKNIPLIWVWRLSRSRNIQESCGVRPGRHSHCGSWRGSHSEVPADALTLEKAETAVVGDEALVAAAETTHRACGEGETRADLGRRSRPIWSTRLLLPSLMLPTRTESPEAQLSLLPREKEAANVFHVCVMVWVEWRQLFLLQ